MGLRDSRRERERHHRHARRARHRIQDVLNLEAGELGNHKAHKSAQRSRQTLCVFCVSALIVVCHVRGRWRETRGAEKNPPPARMLDGIATSEKVAYHKNPNIVIGLATSCSQSLSPDCRWGTHWLILAKTKTVRVSPRSRGQAARTRIHAIDACSAHHATFPVQNHGRRKMTVDQTASGAFVASARIRRGYQALSITATQ